MSRRAGGGDGRPLDRRRRLTRSPLRRALASGGGGAIVAAASFAGATFLLAAAVANATVTATVDRWRSGGAATLVVVPEPFAPSAHDPVDRADAVGALLGPHARRLPADAVAALVAPWLGSGPTVAATPSSSASSVALPPDLLPAMFSVTHGDDGRSADGALAASLDTVAPGAAIARSDPAGDALARLASTVRIGGDALGGVAALAAIVALGASIARTVRRARPALALAQELGAMDRTLVRLVGLRTAAWSLAGMSLAVLPIGAIVLASGRAGLPSMLPPWAAALLPGALGSSAVAGAIPARSGPLVATALLPVLALVLAAAGTRNALRRLPC